MKAENPSLVDKSTHPPLILVVEDEALVREVTTEVLKGAGYRVLQAENAAQARRTLRQHRIDLLLCDSVLPDGDGFAVALDAMERSPALRVLLASGYPEMGTKHRLPARAEFLTKPFTASTLLSQVRAMCGGERAMSQAAGLG